MTRQRSIRAAGAVGCAFALGLSLSAAAQGFDEDPFDPFSEQNFGAQDFSASGEIDRIDLPEGKLVVDGRTYRADPRALQGLQPGQQVFLTYEPIKNQAWIRDLQAEEGFFEGDPLWGPIY